MTKTRPRATFYDYLRSKGLSQGSAKKYCSIARRWRGSTPEAYLARKRDDDMPEGTATPLMAAARHWARWHGYEFEVVLPWRRQIGGHADTPARETAQRVLEQLRPHATTVQLRTAWRAALVALETGLRGSSIAELERRHGRHRQYKVPAKGGRMLQAPMTRAASQAVMQQFDEAAEGFGEPHDLRRFWRDLRAHEESAEAYTLHTFRHVFASHLARTGTGLPTIQRILGHASIQTTEKYLSALGIDVHRAIEGLEPRKR